MRSPWWHPCCLWITNKKGHGQGCLLQFVTSTVIILGQIWHDKEMNPRRNGRRGVMTQFHISGGLGYII